MMSLWDALRMNMMISYQELVRTFLSILMEQWGYRSSVYSPKSKSWVFLRQPYKEVKPIIERINQELQTTWLFGKDGFLDYWK